MGLLLKAIVRKLTILVSIVILYVKRAAFGHKLSKRPCFCRITAVIQAFEKRKDKIGNIANCVMATGAKYEQGFFVAESLGLAEIIETPVFTCMIERIQTGLRVSFTVLHRPLTIQSSLFARFTVL